MADLELQDMQGFIARGYAELKAASYVLLQITSASSARAWLATLATSITAASARPSDSALNVAFTVTGLRKLGLADQTLAQFSNEFRTGMTTPHRRRTLGDVGPSAPEEWLWGGPGTPPPDVLLLLFGRDEPTLENTYRSLANGFANGGVTAILRLEAFVDLDGKEHFGFADGISQPTIAGLSSRVDTPPNTIRPGEFILGYENEYGRQTNAPDLARNGSYVVFRHLSQDVRGFWRFVAAAADAHDVDRTWLASKMVGRWPSGAPLTLTPDSDEPSLANANDFTYQYGDADGLRCPIGAHVRRSHPRDSLDPDPGTARSVAVDKRHRLLRRGREYGPPMDDPYATPSADDPDRGLYFICVMANIARQFELIQHSWVNNPTFDGLYDGPDPLVGQHTPNAAFVIPAHPISERVTAIPQFVTTRGGAYFFLPSLTALNALSAG
ncbi:MAG TPA: Dyp-type peroxidase [Chloroflexota bacterium]|jgi:Dyp-type peroxidase family|nr:Dyp-type peroxidase [Chloroflexota bacterium]